MMQLDQKIGPYTTTDLRPPTGQGHVAKGQHSETGMEVAIKQLNASPGDPHYEEALKRFKLEGAIKIDSPYAIATIETIEDDGRHYIIFPRARRRESGRSRP
jgi:hypothetical protein